MRTKSLCQAFFRKRESVPFIFMKRGITMSTIAAIATPNAPGGISVIRISGENSLRIADMIFKNFSGVLPSDMQGYTCAYGNIVYNNEIVDDVVLTVFRNPKSYTGEDVVEISCHGLSLIHISEPTRP